MVKQLSSIITRIRIPNSGWVSFYVETDYQLFISTICIYAKQSNDFFWNGKSQFYFKDLLFLNIFFITYIYT